MGESPKSLDQQKTRYACCGRWDGQFHDPKCANYMQPTMGGRPFGVPPGGEYRTDRVRVRDEPVPSDHVAHEHPIAPTERTTGYLWKHSHAGGGEVHRHRLAPPIAIIDDEPGGADA